MICQSGVSGSTPGGGFHPPLADQLAAEIPKESGYAGPEEPTQPPSSQIATRVHCSRSRGVTVSHDGAGGGVETVGALGAVVVVVWANHLGNGTASDGDDAGELGVVGAAIGSAGTPRADVIEDLTSIALRDPVSVNVPAAATAR